MKAVCAILVFLSALILMGCGGTYQYYTDPTPSLENNRYQYVKFNPGAPHNNEILSGKIKSGMTPQEIQAAWGRPTAVAPGDRAGIDEVWVYHDPTKSHGNNAWMLRFADGTLLKVEKIVGMAMATGATASGEHLGEQPVAAQADKPF